jgi:tetratricopeptide (TPR) repeat protein
VGFYADQGRLKEAAEVAQRQLVQARDIGLPSDQCRSTAALLAVLERLEEPDKFQQNLEELVDAESGYLDQNILDLGFSWVPALALAGKISARNGNIDQARQILTQVQPLANNSGYFFRDAYTGLLQAEIYLAQSDPGAAIRQVQEVLDGGQLFQAHETLARAYEASGDSRAAIDEYLWLTEQRGLAFAENLSGSYGKEFNILDWVFAHYHLGRLYASIGDSKNATLHYLAFVDHWQSADKPKEALTRAYEYLASL